VSAPYVQGYRFLLDRAFVWRSGHEQTSQSLKNRRLLLSFQSFNHYAPFKAMRRFKVQGSGVQEKRNAIGTSKSQELTESATGRELPELDFLGEEAGPSILNCRVTPTTSIFCA
jgi:hypothetical protein